MLPLATSADHLDVIQFELKDGCSFEKYVAIKDDFNNQWAKDYDYRAEVLMPLQSHDLKSLYWVGRSPDATSFGRAWDAWRAESADPASVAAKLVARFAECSAETARRSYDVY
jgi:hypothetical protein